MKTPFPQLTLSMSTDASPRSRVSTMNQIITLILAQGHIFILVHFLLQTFHLASYTDGKFEWTPYLASKGWC